MNKWKKAFIIYFVITLLIMIFFIDTTINQSLSMVNNSLSISKLHIKLDSLEIGNKILKNKYDSVLIKYNNLK